MLKTIAARYQQLIDYFVPDAIRQDRAASNQARMFLISHTMGPILGNSVPIALFFVDPTPGWDILVLALSITSFWIFPFLLRQGRNYDTLVITSVLNLNFCIFWSCYFNGGVLSPTLPWVLLIPILSFFYIGGNPRLQTMLMSIFAGAFGLFLLLYFTTQPPRNDIPEMALVVLGVISTAAALCYVATMAIYYARIFDAGVELENDVRRRRIATDKLRAAIVSAHEVGLHKAEFLARMSHELRTPLNAVIGYSQVLKEDAIESGDTQMQDDVARIDEAGQYLLRLINAVLDLSKIEAGKMQFAAETRPLAELIAEAAAKVGPAMQKAGNTLDLSLNTDNATICTDRLRLLQILGAVLDNIPVHAPGTQAELGSRTASIITPDDAVEIFIRDNGPGIAADRLGTLFESLNDQRDAAEGRYGGTGLNLTIVHKLAHAMGCSLSVTSSPDTGTCFSLLVPRAWTPASTQIEAPAKVAAA